MTPNRTRARQLAADFLAKGDPTGWFEQLYREAERGESVVPWADLEPNPGLLEFREKHSFPSNGKSALEIGCGFGDTSEHLAAWGFQTTAFDISESAIRACRQRFPDSAVRYVAADLLNPPLNWKESFDFVFEANTFQVLPPDLRAQAVAHVASFVKPGGSLLVIARGRERSDPEGSMPWPLMREELNAIQSFGLREALFEDYLDRETPPARRFRGLYSRPNY